MVKEKLERMKLLKEERLAERRRLELLEMEEDQDCPNKIEVENEEDQSGQSDVTVLETYYTESQ